MEKKCVVWGTREAGRRLAHQAEKVGYSVVAYCSSTKDSQGKQINGRPVVSQRKPSAPASRVRVTTFFLG